jgi:multidrug resistance efflux pump
MFKDIQYWSCFIVVIVITSNFAINAQEAETATVTESIETETISESIDEVAESTSIETLIIEDAILKSNESTAVAAQVAGVIQSMAVREGSRVTSGDQLGLIRDVAVRLAIDKARLALDTATKKQASDIDKRLAIKSEQVARNEYQRAIEANQKLADIYPVNEVDRLKLVFDRATLEVERAAFEQEILKLDVTKSELELKESLELLSRHKVIASCSGIVVSLVHKPGEWVDVGDPVAKIVEIEKLRIEGFLHANDAASSLIGKKAKVTVAIAEETLETEAELVFISPEVNPLNSQVRVMLEVDNSAEKLRPGLRPTTILQLK